MSTTELALVTTLVVSVIINIGMVAYMRHRLRMFDEIGRRCDGNAEVAERAKEKLLAARKERDAMIADIDKLAKKYAPESFNYTTGSAPTYP